jgi:Glycosyltransferase family 87
LNRGLLLIATLVASGVTLYLARLPLQRPEQDDFASFYEGGTAVRTGQLAELYRVERSGGHQELPFIRPPFYALLLAPFSLLPFVPAFWLWIALQLAIFLVCLFQGWRRFGNPALLACLFPPAILGMSHAQDCVLMLAIVIVSYEAARRGKPLWSGSILGLALMKFHLLLLWPVALIAQRRWKMLAGFALTGSILLAISLACAGPEGLRDYAGLITGPHVAKVAPDPDRQFGVYGFLSNLGIASTGLQIALGIVIAALMAGAVRRGGVRTLFLLTPLASLTIVPHVLYYDPTLMLLPLWIGLGVAELHLFAAGLLLPLLFMAVSAPKPYTILFSLGGLVFLAYALASSFRNKVEDQVQ